MATKSKLQSLSAHRTSPRTRSKSLPESNPSPFTFSRASLKPNSSPGTNRTPFSLGAITPIGNLKSVTLSDWWLIKKGKEKTLCVSGFESKGGSEVRLFSSGTITKRHDSITLEAIDGITICINGFINRSRSLQNGITNEVCNRFLFGFPYDWNEEEEGFVEEKKKNVDVSFDDIPVNRLQDLCFLEGCLKDRILDDVVSSLRDLVCPKLDKKCEKSRIGGDESLDSGIVGVKTRGMRRRRQDDDVVSSLRDFGCPKVCEKSRIDYESLDPVVVGVKSFDNVVDSLRGFASPKSDKKCEKSRMDDESLESEIVGVKTRGMLRRRQDEDSIGKIVCGVTSKKRTMM
ncbi:Protein EMBRYO DEFECTIVE [Cardamine amara subsp. amara]|uniref:Protein EMBRYO DEFECTIVE n=1 Tax=Cardamine amara subsp. amara TaxID=228776 RepID=A0ABD1ACJ4_CARAN